MLSATVTASESDAVADAGWLGEGDGDVVGRVVISAASDDKQRDGDDGGRQHAQCEYPS